MEDKELSEEVLELETLEVETRLVEAEVEVQPEMPAKAKYYEELFRGGK
ncbi:unnamed protein product [marine sediment metagenome]|uniref:Uncharacterized protein n=1 Tax=marine sediment metagenome TaxID=412755 RepID=X0TCD9_9ZZZZ